VSTVAVILSLESSAALNVIVVVPAPLTLAPNADKHIFIASSRLKPSMSPAASISLDFPVIFIGMPYSVHATPPIVPLILQINLSPSDGAGVTDAKTTSYTPAEIVLTVGTVENPFNLVVDVLITAAAWEPVESITFTKTLICRLHRLFVLYSFILPMIMGESLVGLFLGWTAS